MKRTILLCMLCLSFLMRLVAIDRSLKLLHLSFHAGCTNDFDDVAKELGGIEVTNWIPADQVKFQGVHLGNAIYNISRDRGKAIWDLHKDYFNEFDVIMSSDTARISRIFLENGWKKPQIIWICNRFDYYDPGSSRFGLPDQEFLNTMKLAINKSNVKIISYTPYEYLYGRKRGVPFSDFTIKPIGRLPWNVQKEFKSQIPAEVKREDTLFLYPRLFPKQAMYVMNQLERVGIKAYTGNYQGAEDIADFKGVLYFPYQWSNFALFEDISQGIVHFVPSEKFARENSGRLRVTTTNLFHLCEWYASENRDLFVYFDSWQDLKKKFDSLDIVTKRRQVRQLAAKHRAMMLDRWKGVFDNIRTQLQA